jgi:hypothetical protein
LVDHCTASVEQPGSVTFDGETIEGAPPLWCAAAAGMASEIDFIRNIWYHHWQNMVRTLSYLDYTIEQGARQVPVSTDYNKIGQKSLKCVKIEIYVMHLIFHCLFSLG